MVVDPKDSVLITGPATEPLSAAEAKAHLRITHSSDDTYVGVLIAAARDMVERYLGRSLITQTRAVKMGSFPRAGEAVILPRPPLISVSSIVYIDESGDEQTLSTSLYQVVARPDHGRIVPEPGECWPSTELGREDAVVVTYAAGYGSAASDVPATIRQAMLLLIGHLYENRESVIIGQTPVVVPQSYEYLLNAHRVEVRV